jgi:hypothetical protein
LSTSTAIARFVVEPVTPSIVAFSRVVSTSFAHQKHGGFSVGA